MPCKAWTAGKVAALLCCPWPQVKLTAEPKKQALELLRSKIEVQNAKVQAVRRRYDSAKQVIPHSEA